MKIAGQSPDREEGLSGGGSPGTILGDATVPEPSLIEPGARAPPTRFPHIGHQSRMQRDLYKDQKICSLILKEVSDPTTGLKHWRSLFLGGKGAGL